MRILVDTHCWLWMSASPERFSARAHAMVADLSNELFLSAASAWEIATKAALGKLTLPVPAAEYVESRLKLTRAVPLPITHQHALRTAELPTYHRDPFDRLLIAQAQIEHLRVLTADAQLELYDVELIWA